MGKKNVVLPDNSREEMGEFCRGLAEESGLDWEVLACRANQGRRGIWNFLRYWRYFSFPFRVFLRRKQYDRVVAWQEFYGLVFAFWCRVFRVEKENFLVVQHFTYREKKGVLGRLYFRFMRFIVESGYVDVFTFCSRGHLEYCGETFRIPREKLRFEPFGVEDVQNGEECAGEYVLSPGRSNRDWEFLIRELGDTEFPVKILCDTLKCGQLPQNIQIYGNVWGEDALKFLRSCRLVVLPILDEKVAAGETVLLQAMSLGKPVVAVRESGKWEEYIGSGENGFVVPKDGKMLRKTLERLWKEEELYQKISRNSRHCFERNYSLFGYGCRMGGLFMEKKEERLVSVVVPVYRAEKYLDDCIRSIVGQSYRNLEILLIDDGSDDDCPRICEEWAAKDDRIRVIHKENEGLGAARNLGISLAKGEFLCFVDSDDFLEKSAIEDARRREADVVVFGFSDVDIQGKMLESFVSRMEKCRFSGAEVLGEFLPEFLAGGRKTGLFPGVCWCLFDMALVRRVSWQFPSERDVICEDIFALLDLFSSVGSVEVVPKPLYNYRKSGESLSRRYRGDRVEKGKIFLKMAWKLCEEKGYSEEIRASCAEPFLGLVLAAMKRERGRNLRRILEDPLVGEAVRLSRRENWKKRLLYGAMERKWYGLCEIMLRIRG